MEISRKASRRHMVETEDKGTLEASRMRGPKAPSMNNSNEERNEESTGND